MSNVSTDKRLRSSIQDYSYIQGHCKASMTR